METKNVVAAIIRKGDKFFATQRGYGEWKDWWECPGGKVEPGETPEEALKREILEELNAEISVDKYLCTVEWDYPTFHLTMRCYVCSLIGEALQLNEHEAARWLDKDTIHSVRWLPADEGLLPIIVDELNGFTIRPAEPRDLQAVGDLLRQVLKLHHDGRPDLFNAEGKKYSDDELLAIFANPQTPVFVYDRGGDVLGYVFCELQRQSSGSLKPLTSLYIDNICVAPEARGQHVGTALFEYVSKYAREKGCYNITLHVWECNPGARAFYESLGLKPQFTSMELICK